MAAGSLIVLDRLSGICWEYWGLDLHKTLKVLGMENGKSPWATKCTNVTEMKLLINCVFPAMEEQCVCMCVHACMHVCMCVHACLYIFAHVCMCARVCMYVYVCKCACVYACVICACVYVCSTCERVHVYMCVIGC